MNGGNGQRNSAFVNYQVSPMVPWIAEIQSTEMCQSGAVYCANPASATLAAQGAYGAGVMKAAYWVVYMGSWLPSGLQPSNVLSSIASGAFPLQSAYPTGW